MMKSGIRILALDDSTFSKKDKDVLVVGVIGRIGSIEGVLSFRVKVDGSDATAKIIAKIMKSRFKDQIKLIAIHGITLAGLNLVDITELSKRLKLPVLCVVKRKPHKGELEKAIKAAAKNPGEKLSLLRDVYNGSETAMARGLHFQYVGLKESDAIAFSESAQSLLRLAHIIANGIVRGESKGRF